MSVSEEWGVCCPSCKRDDALRVAVTVFAELTPEGTSADAEGCDHEWDNDSAIQCRACSWSGVVKDANTLAAMEASAS